MTTEEIKRNKKEIDASGSWYCVRDALAETVKENIEKNGGLPALKGTEKQVAWAISLREKQINYIIEWCFKKFDEYNDNEIRLRQLDYMLEASGEYFAHQTSAKCYIEWRISTNHRAEIKKIAKAAWEKDHKQ